MKKLIIFSLGIAICLVLVWFFAVHQRNPLAKLGVEYSIDHGDHYEIVQIHFWLNTPAKRINGPTFTGEDIGIAFANSGTDNVKDIVVSAANDPSSRAVVKVIVKDSKAIKFHIVESNRICIGFPEEGYVCP